MRDRTLTIAAAGLLAGLLTLSTPAPAQDQPPPPPAGSQAADIKAGQPNPAVDGLVRGLAADLRDLSQLLPRDLPNATNTESLSRDALELSQGMEEIRPLARAGEDNFALRRSYASFDAGFHSLRAQLEAAGALPAGVEGLARRMDDTDAQLHRALGMNPPSRDYYHPRQAPSGMSETQRLAHALVDRAEALRAAIRADMGSTPAGRALIPDADNLAREADAFHDALDLDGRPAVAARAFGPVDLIADRIEKTVTAGAVSPRVKAAWQSFASVEVLIHRNLGLSSPQPTVPLAVVPPAEGGPSPLLPLADALLAQVTDFLNVYGPTAGTVPEGGLMLADGQLLQAAATSFRRDVASGADPSQLAYRFRDADLVWQRLARRVNRVSRGRTGPNIQQVGKMGTTLAQLHDALGLARLSPGRRRPRREHQRPGRLDQRPGADALIGSRLTPPSRARAKTRAAEAANLGPPPARLDGPSAGTDRRCCRMASRPFHSLRNAPIFLDFRSSTSQWWYVPLMDEERR